MFSSLEAANRVPATQSQNWVRPYLGMRSVSEASHTAIIQF